MQAASFPQSQYTYLCIGTSSSHIYVHVIGSEELEPHRRRSHGAIQNENHRFPYTQAVTQADAQRVLAPRPLRPSTALEYPPGFAL